jgi:hypothetical protein
LDTKAMPTAKGEARLCACHSERSRWHRDSRRAAGGYWRCSIKRRAADVRYDTSARRVEARRRYKRSEKGRAAQERYRISDKGRVTERRRILAAATRARAARIEARRAALNGRSWDDLVSVESFLARLRPVPVSERR